jgi:signal transduction histidine kinase/CheY-like chemotaxis protein
MRDLLTLWFGRFLTVKSDNPETIRKGRLFGILVLGALAGVGALTAFNIAELFFAHTPEVVSWIFGDVLTFILTAGLLRLNQIGKTRIASYVFLFFFTVAASFMFSLDELPLVFIIYVVPTVGASFVLSPASAFVFATLSALAYTAAYAVGGFLGTYNYVSIIALFIVALLAWLAATNLENALSEVRKRAAELDLHVAERTSDLVDALQREHSEVNKTQAILSSIGDGVLVFDHNEQAIVVNPAACAIIERGEADVLGRDVSQIMGKAVGEEDQAIIRSLAESQGAPRAGLKVAWGHKTLAVGFAPVKLPFTDQPGTVVVLRDITREAEVDRMKSEFVSIVSHELRTPMTVIKGYVELLLTGTSTTAEMQHDFLEIIRTNADRLSDMVNELLDVSRIEAGKISMNFQPVAVRSAIHEVATMLQKSFADRGIQLNLDLPDGLPDVPADPGRLAQILTNLFSNALKYTLEGHVDVSAHVVDGFVQVDVIDSGIGMSEEDQSKLFTRFFRASTARTHEISGTGLGLSITRSLVEMHGGHIWVKSTVGRGSTFSFTLPVLPASLAHMPTEGAPTTVTRRHSTQSKILVVDDDLQVARSFAQQLEPDGHTVMITTHGKDALPLARRERPDLILLDVVMPDMDGFEVLTQLKQDWDTKVIPVIVISVVAEEEKGFALGAADYLVKPVDSRQLLISVRRVLMQMTRATPGTVLVADDEADIRHWLSAELTRQGCLVTEAQNGEECLAAVATHPPDLILLDLNMPQIDGRTVIHKLKENPQTAGIPIIVLTASSADPEREKVQMLGMGVKQFLTKPVSIEMLTGEVQRQLVRSLAPPGE